MVEGDVYHDLPKASSHFFSDSITNFPSDQAAQRATKQLRSHLHTSFPSFLSLPKSHPLPKLSSFPQPRNLALLLGTSSAAPVLTSVTHPVV